MKEHYTTMTFTRGYVCKRLATPFLLVFAMMLTGCSSKNDMSVVNAPIVPATAIINEVDYSSYFAGRNGCAVFFHPDDNQYDIYNLSMADFSAPYEISSKLAKEITIEIAGDFYGD